MNYYFALFSPPSKEKPFIFILTLKKDNPTFNYYTCTETKENDKY